MNAATAQVLIRPISAGQARPLRAAVLRPGYPFEKSIYPQDDYPLVLHAGAFLASELVGVATVFPEEPPWGAEPQAWRLRGMAVAAAQRDQGIGKQLVHYCLAHIHSHGGRMLWCNARFTALAFYQGLGFQIFGEGFDIPESGLHYRLFRPV